MARYADEASCNGAEDERERVLASRRSAEAALAKLRGDTVSRVFVNRVRAAVRWLATFVCVVMCVALIWAWADPATLTSCTTESGETILLFDERYHVDDDGTMLERPPLACPAGSQTDVSLVLDTDHLAPLVPWAVVPAMLAWLYLLPIRSRDLTALEGIDDPLAVGPVVRTLAMGDEEVRAAGADALCRLLPALDETHTRALTDGERRLLHRALDLRRAEEEFDLQMAVVRALAQVGDRRSAACLRQIAEAETRGNYQERVQAAARIAVSRLEARLERGRHGDRLLRASVEPAELLVRPSAMPNECLVRPAHQPAADEEEQAQRCQR